MKVYAGSPGSASRQWLRRGAMAAGGGAALFGLAWLGARGLDTAREWVQSGDASRPPAQRFKTDMVVPVILPPSDPKALRPVSPEMAEAINAAIPFATGPKPAAAPWRLSYPAAIDQMRSVDCLAAAVYYEAASEPVSGQEAVAQVVLNRVRHPAFPHTVCGAVFEGANRPTGCQFSFTCDGSMARIPSPQGWARARAVAEWALSGHVYEAVGWATHYHADYVVPYWASTLRKVAVIGRHIFYRWDGALGTGPAFAARPVATENDPLSLAMLARLKSGSTAALAAIDPTAPAAVVAPAARPVISNTGAIAPSPANALPRTDVPNAQRWVLGSAPSTPPPPAAGNAVTPTVIR